MANQEQVAEALEAESQVKASGEVSTVPQTTVGEGAEKNEADVLAENAQPGVSTKEQHETTEQEIDDLLKGDESDIAQKKEFAQKRIDKLHAEKAKLQEELARLKAEREQKPGEKAVYTDDQILEATKVALENNDPKLMKEIMDYKISQVKDDLIKMYEQEKTQNTEKVSKIQKEWNETLTAYSKYVDEKTPEVYPGSKRDLNLADPKSLLYNLSLKLYKSDDPDKQAYYQQPGGQKLAVADALTIILARKGSGASTAEAERLKRQLQREKQKNAPISSGSPGEQELIPRSLSDGERLAEVLAERKAYKQERGS